MIEASSIIRIGGVSIDVSHPKAFATNLEKYCMNMRYALEYDDGFRTKQELEWFKNRYGLDGIAQSIEEMAGQVDVGFIQSCNWDKHLDQAMPFIREGKPVFIDKPIVGSMKDIARLRALADTGARIMGSSSIRYCREIRDFLAKSEQERGKILTVYGTSGTDEFNYSIHIVEGMSALAGAPAESCRYLGEVRTEDGQRCQNYLIEYASGIQGIYSACLDVWQPFVLVVVTTKSVYHFEIDLDLIYSALLQQISHALRNDGRSCMADLDTLINCTQIMLCGKKSRDEADGRAVRIEELTPEDAFDGAAFEAEYAKIANRSVYQD